MYFSASLRHSPKSSLTTTKYNAHTTLNTYSSPHTHTHNKTLQISMQTGIYVQKYKKLFVKRKITKFYSIFYGRSKCFYIHTCIHVHPYICTSMYVGFVENQQIKATKVNTSAQKYKNNNNAHL